MSENCAEKRNDKVRQLIFLWAQSAPGQNMDRCLHICRTSCKLYRAFRSRVRKQTRDTKHCRQTDGRTDTQTDRVPCVPQEGPHNKSKKPIKFCRSRLKRFTAQRYRLGLSLTPIRLTVDVIGVDCNLMLIARMINLIKINCGVIVVWLVLLLLALLMCMLIVALEQFLI